MNRKNVVRLTESKLRNMIKETVSQVLKESPVKGTYLDHYPERTGFDPKGKWDKRDSFDDEHFKGLIKNACDAIYHAMDYCRINGEGEGMMLLNSIIAELYKRYLNGY